MEDHRRALPGRRCVCRDLPVEELRAPERDPVGNDGSGKACGYGGEDRRRSAAEYRSFYKLGCNVIPNHADYRLLSIAALRALAEYKEVNLFLRGLIPTIGFQLDVVYFDVKKREAGHSKYTFQKMAALAVDGITSMSIRPIRMITALGCFVSLFSVIMIVLCLADWMMGKNVPGYTTTLMVSCLIGGLTIFSMGIVGEYVGKIYLETKARPRYIVDAVIWKDEDAWRFDCPEERKQQE